MISRLAGCLRAMAERHVRDAVRSVVAATVMILAAAVSLGFATFAAYAYFCEPVGRVVAALIVAAAYGLLFVTIWVVGVMRRRAARSRRTMAGSASSGPTDLLQQRLTTAGSPQADGALGDLALATALQLGRELSPGQLIALAIIGGFIAGRKLGK
jgi:hypothetical protein